VCPCVCVCVCACVCACACACVCVCVCVCECVCVCVCDFWVLIHDNFSRDKIFLDYTHQMVADALVKSLPSPAFVGHQQIMTGHVPCTAALLRCFGGQFLALILSAVFLCFGSIDCLRDCFVASYSASGFF